MIQVLILRNQKNKLKGKKRKEMMKIRAEIYEIEKRKTIEKIQK